MYAWDFRAFTLERQVQFLFEEQTEAYSSTVKGAPEKKIVHGAKRTTVQAALLTGRLVGVDALL